MTYEDVVEYLGQYGYRIRKKRRRKRLSQGQLAKLTHTSQNVISMIENGCFLPPDYLDHAIREALKEDK